MKIQIAQALLHPETVIPFQGEETLDLGAGLSGIVVHIQGKCQNIGESVFLVNGRIEFEIQGHCAKCAKSMTEHISLGFEDKFSKSTEEGEDLYPYRGDVLDLTQALLDEAALALPMRMLCKEDCKGLCPVCGADLNDGDCGCDRTKFVVADVFHEEV